MELAVKDRDIPGLWQLLDAELHDLKRRRIMQWCQVREGLEMIIRILSYNLRPIKVAAVHHSVARNWYVFFLAYVLQIWIIDQLVEHVLKCIVLRGDRLVNFLPFNLALTTPTVFQQRRGSSQAIDLNLRQLFRLLGTRGAIDGDFDGTGASVDGQNNFRHFKGFESLQDYTKCRHK